MGNFEMMSKITQMSDFIETYTKIKVIKMAFKKYIYFFKIQDGRQNGDKKYFSLQKFNFF